MKRAMMIVVWFGWLIPAAVSGGIANDIRIATRVAADSVTVGERFAVVYEVSYPDSLEFVPPESFEPGSCRLIDLAWREQASGGRVEKRGVLELMTTDLDAASLPGADFVFVSPGGDTTVVRSRDVEVPVRRLTGEASDPRPLKPQWKAPRSYVAWLIAGAAAVLAAILAAYLIRRRRKGVVPEAPRPRLPADFVALRRLDEIERMNLPEAGEFKRYYTLVVDALRTYLEDRFGVMAMDRTTDEILWDLARIRVDVRGLEPLLREADLVKFAKHRPSLESAAALMENAREIVARTAPRPLAAGEGE